MDFEVIIVGGSYAGLSAALSLGRARRKVLVIDAGKPCNRQTPHSHNLLTHDGQSPAEISTEAKADVLKYPTVQFLAGSVVSGQSIDKGFAVQLAGGENFSARKLLIATGLKDTLPSIEGFAACWAISVIHCPYCHGYEVRDEKIGLLMNDDHTFEMAKNLHHWNKDLTILTNGKSNLLPEEHQQLAAKFIRVIEDKIVEIVHEHGYIKHIVFAGGNKMELKALYARPEVAQHMDLDLQLGYELTPFKTIKINEQQKTTVDGIYAAGDCATLMRSLSVITAAGTLAAVAMNKEMISEDF